MENKRILILSANTGEGHNSAARALSEAFEARGCRCTIQDGLTFLPAALNRIICRSHIFLYRRLPKLYGFGYRLAERASRHKKPALRRANYNQKLLNFLESGRFDAVICTHVFAAGMLSRLRLADRIKLPCYFLATDYTCSPGVNRLDMDAWFIPHQGLIEEFAAAGIAEDRIAAAGIPVCKEFLRKNIRNELRRKLNLPENRRIAVLSCGSMGAGNMEGLVSALAKALPEGVLLIALCGSNRSLLDRLRHMECEKLLALGFVESLADYMQAADVYIAKPGGLNSTEAMCAGIPALLFNAVPGVETRNLEFLGNLGCTATAQDRSGFARLARRALEDEAFARSLSENCARHFDGCAAGKICEYVCKKELSD